MSEKTRETVSIYRATNTVTGVIAHIDARDATEACQKLGWEIGETYVTVVKPRQFKDEDGQTGFFYLIPGEVCPFQYAQCKRPNSQDCPVHISAPDFTQWLKQISQAHLCPWVGKSVSKKDHERHLVALTEEEAIVHIRSKRH